MGALTTLGKTGGGPTVGTGLTDGAVPGGGGGAVPVGFCVGQPYLHEVTVIVDVVRWVEIEVTDPCL